MKTCFGGFSFSVSSVKLLCNFTSFLNQMPYARNQYSELACKTEEVACAHVKVLAFSFITYLSSKLLRRVCVLYFMFIVLCQHSYLLSDLEGNASKHEVGFIFLPFPINYQKAL